MSTRANAFAIASIMSDPNADAASVLAAAAAAGVGPGVGGYGGYNPIQSSQQQHRSSDCRFQLEWSPGHDNGYSLSTSGLKAMEGETFIFLVQLGLMKTVV